MNKNFVQVSEERYQILTSRYGKFQSILNEEHMEPVRVFDPLSQKAIDELFLIREVSKNLQIKKNEDVSKAAQNEVEAKEIESAAVTKNAEPALKEDS